MTQTQSDNLNIIEPFDPDKHDRAAFSCGVEQVDNFFKKTANKLSKADNIRVFVLVSSDSELIGFYAINTHSVDYEELPRKYARARPRHRGIPAAYLSMMGVDTRFARKGYGGDLIADALKRIARVARQIGIAVVMLDVLDDGNPDLVERRKKLYCNFGFMPLQSDGLRLFLPIETAQKILDDEEAEE